MSGARIDSASLGRTILAFGLCFLAFSFAIEAKMAWYGPQRGLGSDVRAAKALPADVPEIIPHGITGSNPIYPVIPFALLLALATQLLPVEELAGSIVHGESLAVHGSAFFSPHSFFRPPPSR